MREGFDPNSLTMPQLRGILVEHQVSFSSAARKADLVDLFNSSVLPKTASLRKKNASIVASSSGIIDMRGDDTVVTPEQTPAKRKPGRPRKSEVATPSKTPAKTPAKVTGRTPGRPKKSSLANQLATATESEAEPEEKPAPKVEEEEVEVPKKRGPGRPRKSAPAKVAAPVEVSDPEPEAEEEKTSPRRVSFDPKASPPASSARKAGRLSYGGSTSAGRKSDDDGTFSDSNPFQSGSEASPAAGIAAKAAASARKARRKTTDGTSTLRKKTSSSSLAAASPPKKARQSSPGVASTLRNYMDQAVAATTPPRIISRLAGTTSADSAKDTRWMTRLQPGKPMPTLELKLTRMISMSKLSCRPLPLPKFALSGARRTSSDVVKPALVVSLADYLTHSLSTIFLVSVLAWTVWYARESRALGFCDTGSDTNAIVEDRRLPRSRTPKPPTKRSKTTLLFFLLSFDQHAHHARHTPLARTAKFSAALLTTGSSSPTCDRTSLSPNMSYPCR